MQVSLFIVELGGKRADRDQASATGIVQAVSAAASYSLTDILDEKDRVDGESGRKMGMVYQVYFQRDRSKTEAQVREAVEGGVQCVHTAEQRDPPDSTDHYRRALVLTVDSNVGDNRQSTEKLKGSRGSAERGVHMDPITTTPTFHDSRLNWTDIPWLQELADGLPIYLKGVCHIDVSVICSVGLVSMFIYRMYDMPKRLVWPGASCLIMYVCSWHSHRQAC